jgi:Putative Actinobacterial Holin-X, holin superfamily III
MAEPTSESIPVLIRSVMEDARALIRQEIALARVEIREEASKVRTVGIAFGAAAITGLIAVVLLCVALGGAIAYALSWPTWAGDGVVAILLAATATGCATMGRSRLSTISALPKTTATMRENMAWIQGKSNSR